jgi:Tfp pilus assembly protein PilX
MQHNLAWEVSRNVKDSWQTQTFTTLLAACPVPPTQNLFALECITYAWPVSCQGSMTVVHTPMTSISQHTADNQSAGRQEGTGPG